MKKTAILFPGQGSQYVGMGSGFLEYDKDAGDLLEMASEKSGMDLRSLCLEGPMESLTRVLNLQPALTTINLICWQQLRKKLPDFRPLFVAGHSLGEYSALHAAGVLSAEDTIRLVTRRGELMEREGAANPGGMRAVLGLTIEQIEQALADFQGQGTVVVANHNTEQQVVLSGDDAGLDGAAVLLKELGGKIIPLKVSVANHSPLVAGAVADFADFMTGIPFQKPAIPVIFNITADQEDDPERIRSLMARQIASRVRWLESVRRMLASGVEVIVELGPKTVLTGIVKKILPPDCSVVCLQADSPETLEKVVAEIA